MAEEHSYSVRFQVLAILLILCSALSGAILGIILSQSNPSENLISWIALPGVLFIRALKCVILPLVFVNVIIAMIQLSAAGKAKTVGFYTITIYFATTIVASLEGLIVVLLFSNRFSVKEAVPKQNSIKILCPSGAVLFQTPGSISCVNESLVNDQNGAKFVLEDMNDFFKTNEGQLNTLSLSDTLQENVFRQMVPDNIFREFADFRFLGVITFSILFGIASQSIQREPITIVRLLNEINDIMMMIVTWIIFMTPISVFSLIAGALGPQEDLYDILSDVSVLVAVTVFTHSFHIFISWPIAYYLITGTSPIPYMKYLIPAQFFAFATGSSAATLPATLKCVKDSGMVPDEIREFVLPIGATINMDGIAIYFPPALIFLANSVGLSTGVAEYFLIILSSTIGSTANAPLPNASLLLLLTAFSTVYGIDAPDTFGILFGIHWLIGRCTVVVSITGDAMVARLVTYLVVERKQRMLEKNGAIVK